MLTRSLWIVQAVLLVCLVLFSQEVPANEDASSELIKDDRLRVVILSDMSNEPDDQQSLVRFLTYANEFDIEGIIATTSCWRKNNPDKATILQVLDAYEKVQPNIARHAVGYPVANALREVTKSGVDGYGMQAAAEQLNNEGIDLIITVLDREDPRPVWFCVWGGGNTLGGAVMKLQRERPHDAERLVAKIRGYEIALQDDAFAYVAHHYPDTFLISAKLLWKGISRTTPRFNAWSESWGGDDALFNAAWVAENVQSKGPLGAVYPNADYLWEGDTPSFLYLVPNGLSDPNQPHWGSWGGRFTAEKVENVRTGTGNDTVDPLLDQHRPYRMFSDAKDSWTHGEQEYNNEYATVFRWRRAFQNDFAARMNWSITEEFTKANHHPRVVLNGDASKSVTELKAKSGASITVSAAGSSDPDGDSLAFRWWIYPEPTLANRSEESLSQWTSWFSTLSGIEIKLQLPQVAAPTSYHVILEVEDSGSPSLFAYRRLIVHVTP
ncbi:DUF1593 domain-containing protein [Pirellulaceae bacterium SH449]